MKIRSLFFLLIALTACTANHEHDGIYIAEEPYMGVMKTWIIEGNAITYYHMGQVKVAKCKQYADRIVADDITYPFDAAGNLIVPGRKGVTADQTLVKRSPKTKFTPAEIEKMIDEAMPPPGVLKGQDATR